MRLERVPNTPASKFFVSFFINMIHLIQNHKKVTTKFCVRNFLGLTETTLTYWHLLRQKLQNLYDLSKFRFWEVLSSTPGYNFSCFPCVFEFRVLTLVTPQNNSLKRLNLNSLIIFYIHTERYWSEIKKILV